jgi:FkbM family methyltransferase
MNFYSQCGQDKYIDELLKGRETGFFLDIGAHDGVTGSNTFFFEKYRGWGGVCVEPNPNVFSLLKQNRSCMALNACIFNDDRDAVSFQCLSGYTEMLSGIVETFDQKHRDRIERELKQHGGCSHIIEVKSYKVSTLLNTIKQHTIDYCSIDTEGSELQVLLSIDFNNTFIDVMTIENNNQTTEVKDYLEQFGYELIHKIGNQDDVFKKVK